MDLIGVLEKLCGAEEYNWRIKDKDYRAWRLDGLDAFFWQSTEGKALFARLYHLTQLGFVQSDSPSLREDTENHIFGGEYLYLTAAGNQIVSYSVLKQWRADSMSVLYLSGIMVHPFCQGTNLASGMLKKLTAQFKADLLILRTQSPVMYESAARACSAIFPGNTDGMSCDYPLVVRQAGEFTAKAKLSMDHYDPETMTGERTYGCCLYGVEPVSKNPVTERWFKERVNLQRGDAMIVVGIP